MSAGSVILVLNSGSSSLKFGLYQFAPSSEAKQAQQTQAETRENLLASGEVAEIGKPAGRLQIKVPVEAPIDVAGPVANAGAAAAEIFTQLRRRKLPQPDAAGHRIVNGGSDYSEPARVTPGVLAKLRALASFAPVHLPAELDLISAVSAEWPEMPQVACFDTAFHSRMPAVAHRLPLPRAFYDQGLRRYGFHGLSYEYLVQKLGSVASRQRLILAHLGNGSSLAAVADGQPLETTMGFTPTGGVMMGTRSGDLDPGVLLYLLREKHYEATHLEKLVDQQSGLLGVSGRTSDMKELLERSASDTPAREAVELFCYLVRKQVGALAAVLGGLDGLVFTGGIGENAAPVRAMICAGLEFLGVTLDAEKNERREEIISAAGARCAVRVVATNEELMIARHTERLLRG